MLFECCRCRKWADCAYHPELQLAVCAACAALWERFQQAKDVPAGYWNRLDDKMDSLSVVEEEPGEDPDLPW